MPRQHQGFRCFPVAPVQGLGRIHQGLRLPGFVLSNVSIAEPVIRTAKGTGNLACTSVPAGVQRGDFASAEELPPFPVSSQFHGQSSMWRGEVPGRRQRRRLECFDSFPVPCLVLVKISSASSDPTILVN